MHYSSSAFAKDPKINTITPKQKEVSASSLGQRSQISAKDALKINNMYKGIC